MRSLTKGLLAGAAGTVALNVVSYGDMLLRGRGSSNMPATIAGKLAGGVGVRLGEDEKKDHREEALGALLGYVTGLGVGAAYGLARRDGNFPVWAAGPLLAAAAMAGSDLPATAMKVTDPTTWSLTSWVSDIIPHMAYGFTAASVHRALR
ncbi:MULTISPECIES: hypothetical protein [Streptomyces]|uniref:DUF1440 domain-containing protein n=1 Tax=Streptomyces canarius TaxID=285453 RepID=A0ABQ3DBQ7_9ACTN|nr:hypothetical protein [Streptomyces canarius]GHA73367.1 hypothetical protein GCM10010345_90170 [Streptomyces canarius]